jgi:hypothetical protein
MPFDPYERERLLGVAQNYADAAGPEVRLRVEDRGSGVLFRRDSADRDGVETLNVAWELIERSSEPEAFLRAQVAAIAHESIPADMPGRQHQ